MKNRKELSNIIGLACMIVVLDYMRSRFGLKPDMYSKQDIEFEVKTEEVKL